MCVVTFDFCRPHEAITHAGLEAAGYIIFLSSPQSHVTASRRALEAFLVRYPLCYGYWKKYADLERRAGYNDKAEEVKREGK